MKVAFAYVTDERGLELAKHSIVSVALSQPNACDIHLFCYHFSPASLAQFATDLTGLRAKVIAHTISDLEMEQHETWGHVTTPTLLKLSAVDKLFGSYDRVVYFDNDIVVFGDLKIDAIRFGASPIAAVADMDLSDTGAFRDSAWAHGGDKTNALIRYFNAGVLIFESKNWRNEFLSKYAAALDQHDIECLYKIDCTSIDQCAINSVFEDNWVKLPLSYNTQASAKFTSAWQTASVRHYCGTRKVIPVSSFRNDSRDIRYLNDIRQVLGRPKTHFPMLYELMFRLNALRNYSGDLAVRRYMRAVQADVTTHEIYMPAATGAHA